MKPHFTDNVSPETVYFMENSKKVITAVMEAIMIKIAHENSSINRAVAGAMDSP